MKKYILILLTFISFNLYSQEYSTVDDWNWDEEVDTSLYDYKLVAEVVEVKPLKGKVIPSDYQLVVLNGDTMTYQHFQTYWVNSGHFIWGRTPCFLGTSNYQPFYHNSYQRNSIYNNGRLVNILHVRFR